MQYKVKIILNILTEDRRWCATGHMEIVLPFPPYEGLQIELSEELCFRICLDSIEWVHYEQQFWCYAQVHENLACDPPLNLEFFIDEARDAGFEGFKKITDLEPESRD